MLDKIKGFLTPQKDSYGLNHFLADSDEIKTIDISVLNRTIIVKRSKIERVEIRYHSSIKDKIIISEENDMIKLENSVKGQILNFIPMSSPINKIEVSLPESLNINLKIRVTNGSITLDKLDFIKNSDISSVNGTVNIVNLIVDDFIKISTTNGAIKCINIDAKSFIVSSINGSITFKQARSNDMVLNSTNGAITLNLTGSIKDYHIQAKTSNGNIRYLDYNSKIFNSNPQANNKVTVSTKNGNISINSID